jgi:hypothetical protein
MVKGSMAKDRELLAAIAGKEPAWQAFLASRLEMCRLEIGSD